jgi:PAS domain S-box-containing protein
VVIEAINNGAAFYLQKGGDSQAQFAELSHKIRQAFDKRQAETALQESEENYRHLFDEAADLIAIIDSKGTFLNLNRKFEEESGYSRAEMIGRNVLTSGIVTAEAKIKIEFHLMRLSLGIIPPIFEIEGIHKNGTIIPYELRATPVRKKGAIVGVQAILRNITERMKTEQALRDSEQKFRAIIDQSFGFVGLLTTNGTLVDVNKTALDFAGVKESEVLNKPFWETVWWNHSPELQQRLREAIKEAATGKSMRFEATHPAADGHIAYVDFSLKPVYDSKGNVIFLIPEGRDITRHRQAEDAVKEGRQQLYNIVQGLPVPLFVIDKDHRVVSWNRALEKYSGISERQIIGTPDQWRAFYSARRPTLADLVVDGAVDRIDEFYGGKCAPSALVQSAYQATDFFPHVKGGVWFSFTASPLYDAQGAVIGAVETLQDLTVQKEREVELRAAYEQLHAAFEQAKAGEDALLEQRARLVESEERYRTMVESQNEFITRFRPDGTHVFVNEAYCRYYNKRPDDIIGQRFIPSVPPDDYEPLRAHFASFTPECPDARMEHRIIMPDGGVRWQEWSDHAVFDMNDVIVEFLSVGRDITDRKLAEMALTSRNDELAAAYEELTAVEDQLRTNLEDLVKSRQQLAESELRYRTVFETTGNATVLLDEDTTISLANDGFARLSGYPKEEIENKKSWTEFVVKEDLERMIAQHNLRRKNQNLALQHYRFRFVTREGGIRHISLAADTIPGTKKSVASLLDITDQVKMEEALRSSEELHRTIFETVPEGIALTDATGNITYASPAALELFGLVALEEAIGSSIFEWIAPAMRDEAKSRFIRFMGSGSPKSSFGTIFPMQKKDTTPFLAEVSSNVLLDPDGKPRGMISILRDVSARIAAEDALKRATTKLNLLSAITRHDILNKITVLMGYIELSRQAKDLETVRDFLKKIDTIAGMLEQQIEFTKDYQDLGVKSPKWQDLSLVCSKAKSQLDLGKVRIIDEVAGVEIFADPLFEKVVYNIIDNALRYGGKITTIRISCSRENGYLTWIIEDDGVGIPVKDKHNIFNKGFGSNTGFGLFLAREILAITGMGIMETGFPGTGARFEIHVPHGNFRERPAG